MLPYVRRFNNKMCDRFRRFKEFDYKFEFLLDVQKLVVFTSASLKEKCDNFPTIYDDLVQLKGDWGRNDPCPFCGRSYVCPAGIIVLFSFPKGT